MSGSVFGRWFAIPGAMILLLCSAGCTGELEPGVVAGVDACAHCNMVIDRVNQACGYVVDGEFVSFDSPGCLLASYEARKVNNQAVPDQIFFAPFEGGAWNSAQNAWFLITEHRATVMDSGVLSFASRAAAEGVLEHPDEWVTDWTGYRLLRGQPDRVVKIVVRPDAMLPETVEVDKGQLVLWKVSGAGLESDLEVAIQGYPEAGSIRIPASGEEVSFRLLATRPGSGFPVVETRTGVFLGRVNVVGAHTADEEAM